MIIRAGELGREMFFIKAGAVQVGRLLLPSTACTVSAGCVAVTKQTGNASCSASIWAGSFVSCLDLFKQLQAC